MNDNEQTISLPPVPTEVTPEAVACYAYACLKQLGMTIWHFDWDRTTRRLGCCKMQRRRVSLSIYFVEAYATKDPEQIWRTLRHELAHILAWENHRVNDHGPIWQKYCAALGIPDENATTRNIELKHPRKEPPPRYALCHKETGEVYRTYTRMPRTSNEKLRYGYIPGRKEETLGKLIILPIIP